MSVEFNEIGLEFKTTYPLFYRKCDELTKKSLNRVLKSLVTDPLEKSVIDDSNELEKETYELGLKLQQLKINMMIESLRLDMEKHLSEGDKNG